MSELPKRNDRFVLGPALFALMIGATPIRAAPTAPHVAPVPPPSLSMPGDVLAALLSARATISKAPGMRDEDRRAALSSIDRAIAGLDRPAPIPR